MVLKIVFSGQVVLTKQVKILTGPVKNLTGPAKKLTGPVKMLTGPIKIVTGSVKMLTGPMSTSQKCGLNLLRAQSARKICQKSAK